jgi:hypothetical protein
MIKNITMKPRIGYFSYMKGVSRFEFIYPEASGYENWMWTDFDIRLVDQLHSNSDICYVCHGNQPTQKNGLSFINCLKSIFDDLIEIDVPIEPILPVDNWWYKTIDKLFSAEDENTLYCAEITDKNIKDCFLANKDIGCFWYIIFLEEGGKSELFSVLNESGIDSDNIIHNNKIKFVIYRDYLKNCISIITNDENRNPIDEFISKSKILMQEKNISDIFDTSYIDNLASKKVNL